MLTANTIEAQALLSSVVSILNGAVAPDDAEFTSGKARASEDSPARFGRVQVDFDLPLDGDEVDAMRSLALAMRRVAEVIERRAGD